ncbi:MAG: hypothetical protein QOJ19_2635, partial [Acidimicrobiia bacterium]|nr:hypothetical protein [Acidimicrobiia bacterium]
MRTIMVRVLTYCQPDKHDDAPSQSEGQQNEGGQSSAARAVLRSALGHDPQFRRDRASPNHHAEVEIGAKLLQCLCDGIGAMVYAFGLLGFENGLGSLGAGTGKTSFATLRTPDIPGASKTFGMRLQSEGGTTPVQGDVVAWSGKGNA